MTGVEKHSRSVHVSVASARSTAQRPNGQSVRTLSKGVIGFIGLGRMGTEMAANLATAGRRVVAHVRHPERLSELEVLGTHAYHQYLRPIRLRVRREHAAQRQRPARSCLRAKLKRSGWARIRIDPRSDPYINEHHQHEQRLPVRCWARRAWPRLRGRAGLRQSGRSPGSRTLHYRRRRFGRCRALPPLVRHSGTTNLFGWQRAVGRKSDQACRQRHDGDDA